jgi:hypothetical protein
MSSARVGWLIVIVGSMLALAAVGVTPQPADAAIITSATKTCTTTATPGVNTCTLVVNFTGGSAFNGDTNEVTLAPGTGAATFNLAAPPTGVTNNPANCTVTVAAVTANTYQYRTSDVVAGGCALAATTRVTLTESLLATASGTITETALNPFAGSSATATATVTAGVPVPTSVTKSCTVPGGIATVGVPFTCVVTVTFSAAPVAPVPAAVSVTNGSLLGGPFVCAAGNTTCTFTETIIATTAGTVPAQTIVIAGTTFTPALTGVTAVVAAAGSGATATTATVACAPSGSPPPAANNTCTLTVTLGGALPGGGTISVSLAGGVFAAAPTVSGCGGATSGGGVQFSFSAATAGCPAGTTLVFTEGVAATSVSLTQTVTLSTGQTVTAAAAATTVQPPATPPLPSGRESPALPPPAPAPAPSPAPAPALVFAPRATLMRLAGCREGAVPAASFFDGALTQSFTVQAGAAPMTVTCAVEIDDRGPLGEAADRVSSGVVSLTVGVITGDGASATVSADTGATASLVAGLNGTVRCGAHNTVGSCDFVLITVTVSPSQATGMRTVMVTGSYMPDNPLVNTPESLGAVAAFTMAAQPSGQDADDQGAEACGTVGAEECTDIGATVLSVRVAAATEVEAALDSP